MPSTSRRKSTKNCTGFSHNARDTSSCRTTTARLSAVCTAIFISSRFGAAIPSHREPGATYGELIITNYDPRPYIQPQFKIRPHVIHLMRGQAFELQGRTFFTMGGAQSHDIADGILDMDSPDFYERYDSMRRNRGQFRINHISWWQEELPSDEEYAEARQTLKRLDWKVDYIITHCAPTAIQQKINANFRPNKLTDFLEEVRSRSQFHYWLFGHYHDNRIIDEKYVMLYEQMVRIL